MTIPNVDRLYRYDDSNSRVVGGQIVERFGYTRDEGSLFFLWEFRVLRQTEKGYWISTRGAGRHEVFVLGTPGKKRFAYPTKSLALRSYIRRKEIHASVLLDRRTIALRCLETAQTLISEETQNEN